MPKIKIILLFFVLNFIFAQIKDANSLPLTLSQFHVISIAPLTRQQVLKHNFTVEGKYSYEWVKKPNWAKIQAGSIFGNVSTDLSEQSLVIKYFDEKNNSKIFQFFVTYNNKSNLSKNQKNISYILGATTSRVHNPNKNTFLILVQPIIDPCLYHLQQIQNVNHSLSKLQTYQQQLSKQFQQLNNSKLVLINMKQNITAEYITLNQQLLLTQSLLKNIQINITSTQQDLQTTIITIDQTTKNISQAIILLLSTAQDNSTNIQSQIIQLNDTLFTLNNRLDIINKDLRNIELNLLNIHTNSITYQPQQLYKYINTLNNNRASDEISKQQVFYQIVVTNNTILEKQKIVQQLRKTLKKYIDITNDNLNKLEQRKQSLIKKLQDLIVKQVIERNIKNQIQKNISKSIETILNVVAQLNMTDLYIKNSRRLIDSAKAQIRRDKEAVNHKNGLLNSCRINKTPVITHVFENKIFNVSEQGTNRILFEDIRKQQKLIIVMGIGS